MGCSTVYIHCDAKAERLRRYRLRQGFAPLGGTPEVAHYDQPL